MHRFDELWRDGDRRAFAIECSSGTYVRSLVADLGDAYCEQLRRTRIGDVRRRRRRPAAAGRALDQALALPARGAAAVRAGAARRTRRPRARGGTRRRRGAGDLTGRLIALAEAADGSCARWSASAGPRSSRSSRLGPAHDGAESHLTASRLRRMQVTRLPDAEPRPRRVAVGEFDGVHLGHREVIAGSDTVLTFEPHPLAVVRPEAAPKLLMSLDAKVELIAHARGPRAGGDPVRRAVRRPDAAGVHRRGAGRTACRPPTCRWARTSASAIGPPAIRQLLAADPRFETRVVTLVEVDGEVVSSSHIRALVLAGDVDHAARFLGSPFQLVGEVVTGDRRGRTLGFPTANIVPDENLVCPGHGVYAAHADGCCAAVSVGVRPTFGTGRAVLVEAYLIDRDVDLYGRDAWRSISSPGCAASAGSTPSRT